MIPKIIHYCWFGNKNKPAIFESCIKSWKKYCPDYKIIEWNEKNFDVNQNRFMKEALSKKQFAFVSDCARLLIIKEFGGIYLDIDVELIKPIDSLLKYDFFAGLDERGLCNTGEGFGAVANNDIVNELLKQYQNNFILENGKYDDVPCPTKNQISMENIGFTKEQVIQEKNNAVLFPREYFCPIEYSTNNTCFSDKTLAVHHYNASWRTRRAKIEFKKAKGEKLTLLEKIIVLLQKIKKSFKKIIRR